MKNFLTLPVAAFRFLRLEPVAFFTYILLTVTHRYPKSSTVPRLIENDIVNALRHGKSLIRVGDGESMLLTGRSIHFQTYHPALRKSLKKMIMEYLPESPYILAVPYFAIEESFESLFKRGRTRIWKLFRILFTFFPKHTPYADAVDFYHKDAFEKIVTSLPQGSKLLILSKKENNTPELKIFFDMYQTEYSFYPVPAQHAYGIFNNIKEYVVSQINTKPLIVLVAMGPAGKVLAYELSKMNVQCIDIGHGIEILGKSEDYSHRL